MRLPTIDKKTKRYPRSEEQIVQYIAKLRRIYPPPKYNSKTDGTSGDPASFILNSLATYKKSKLRKYCDKHALETIGSRFKLIKRLYLHWRAFKLQTGEPYVGYGKGFESTRTPTCICAFNKVEYEKKKEELKDQRRRLRKEEARSLSRQMSALLSMKVLKIVLKKIKKKKKFNKKFRPRRFPRLLIPRFTKRGLARKYYSEWKKMHLVLNKEKK